MTVRDVVFFVVLSILSPISSETISYSIRRKNNTFYQNISEKIYVLFPSKTKVKVENTCQAVELFWKNLAVCFVFLVG